MSILNQFSIKSLYMLSVVANSKNLKQAASKLCISLSALSHQMQRLEEKAGKKIFFKDGRNQKLHPEAIEWANSLHSCFSEIENRTNEFVKPKKQIVDLGLPNAFAFNRVIPELGMWLQKHSDVDVRVRMLNCEDDPETLNLDVVLSNDIKNKDYESEKVAPEKYLPVCSKELLRNLSDQQQKEFYNKVPLLELTGVESWEHWGKHTSLNINPEKVIYFSHTILLLQAVMSSQGVALLDYYLIKEQLENGSLVTISNSSMTLDGMGHYLSTISHRKDDPAVAKVKSWLVDLFS